MSSDAEAFLRAYTGPWKIIENGDGRGGSTWCCGIAWNAWTPAGPLKGERVEVWKPTRSAAIAAAVAEATRKGWQRDEDEQEGDQ